MTDTTGLEWLTEGATVAYISGVRHRVEEATVDKIGKRDVKVTVNGRSELFNIGVWIIRPPDESRIVRWLYRTENVGVGDGAYLAPIDHPMVIEYQKEAIKESAVNAVLRFAKNFEIRRSFAAARELRSAVDAYLSLKEEQE